MQYSKEVEEMVCVKKGPHHGPAPIPEEGKWVKSKQITDISGLTHGVGWCAPQQGMCKLTLNVKDGIIEEALIETSGCSGMDALGRDGGRGDRRQDAPRSAQHGPRVRRDQHRDARAVPANRLRQDADRILRRRPADRRGASKTSERACVRRSARFSPPTKRAFVTLSWRKAISLRWALIKTTK